ncbi:MAG: hypothetical protein NC416_12970 [Eubacterium sp.]|nr:hypothetical protein [Eubacterium sp.]
MMKKAVAVVLSLTLAFGLFGCGNSSGSTGSSTESTAEPAAEAEEASEPEEAAQPEASDAAEEAAENEGGVCGGRCGTGNRAGSGRPEAGRCFSGIYDRVEYSDHEHEKNQ